MKDELLISNCCGTPMPDADECDLCPSCLEHCEAIEEGEGDD